jgi:Uma2 family endonuclease
MERKLRDYFAAGVRLVWYIDPRSRTARAYTSPDKGEELTDQGSLSGGDVLPGFELSLSDLFAEIDLPDRQA